MGYKKAFLIQNMFPVTANYISATYIDRNTQNPVTIAPGTEKDIVENAKHILKLVFRGYNDLVFSDVLKTRSDLILELDPGREKSEIGYELPPDADSSKPPMSMKERFAAAQAEATRRNDARATDQSQHYPDKTNPEH